LVADDLDQELESIRQLARIGYDRVTGVLDGGFRSWLEAGRRVSSFPCIRSDALERRLLAGEQLVVVDVREAGEWTDGHVPGSVNVPVHDVPVNAGKLPLGATLAVHCGHVYRATLGASLLEQMGHDQLMVVEDGYEGWQSQRVGLRAAKTT
jgi:hydroxyacylglutathione hydrolase